MERSAERVNASRRLLRGCLAAALGLWASVFAPPPAASGEDGTAKAATSRIAVYAAPEASSTQPLSRQVLLVGIILSGREVGALEVLRSEPGAEDGGFLVPLEPLVEWIGCSLVDLDDGILGLETPLGSIDFEPADIVEIDGVRYLSADAIENKLATPVVFDEVEFALRFDLPWRRSEEEEEAPAMPLVADVRAPRTSLSTVRFDAQYSDSDFTGERFDSNTLLAGRALGGRWQARVQDDFAGNQRWQDYAWLRRDGNRLWLAGHQRVQLHPLLPGLELTGGQVAWTNRPLALFSRVGRPGELLPRRLRPVDSYEGTGPAAGLAELRIDGRVIARRTIGLDGRYGFYDVPLPNRQLTQVEVYVYDRHDLAVPVSIHERTRSTSEFLLPDGVSLHQGGAGYGGNLAQDALDGAGGAEAAGFYQARWGLREGFTVEAAAQRSAERLQLMAGFVARLHRSLVFSLGLGQADGASGYSLELDGLWPRWRLRGRSQLHQAGFRSDGSEETFDHVADVRYAASPRLELGLVGRSRQQPGQRSEFLLPAVAWRPRPGLSFRVRPDEEGDYVGDLSWRVSRRSRFAAHHQDERTFLDFSQRLGRRYDLFAGVQRGGDLAQRYSVALRHAGRGHRRTSWTVGGIFAEEELGFRLAASTALVPGVLLRLDWEDDPLPFDARGSRNRQLLVGLTTDLTWSGGRLLPARSLAIRDDRGAVAGRVRIDAPGSQSYPLADLWIRIDGRAGGRTVPGGSFFIGNLPEGVYRLELDRENLPIELAPERIAVAAEVAGGAVTRVEFLVRPEFGIAGRVTGSGGAFLAGVRVELLDAGGRAVASAVTDRFGLYRIDRLPIGRYVLKISPESIPGAVDELPSRPIEIADDFLFGQDLVLPAAAGADGAGIDDRRLTEKPTRPASRPPETGLGAETAESEARLPFPPAETPDPGGPAERVAAWVRAWSEQRVDDYLGFYARSFRPAWGLARGEWEARRRTRLEAPQFIDLEITGLEVETRGPGRVRVCFSQTYRSDSYRDRVQKTLILVLEEREWRIVEERIDEVRRFRPPIRAALGDGLVALLAEDRQLYLESTAALRSGEAYRLPLESLELTHQLRLLGAFFPADRLLPGGWEHRVTLDVETLSHIAKWLTGRGENHPRLQQANGLGDAVIHPGQVLRVPSELLLPSLRRALPGEGPGMPLVEDSADR